MEREKVMAPIAGSRVPVGEWVERSPRRVRAYVSGVCVADTEAALLAFDRGPTPTYWFPRKDVEMSYLAKDTTSSSGSTFWNLDVGGRVIDKAARTVSGPALEGAKAPLDDHVCFYWDKVDQWFEEDEEVFVHPRSPYHRVDTCRSSRTIMVTIDSTVVATSSRPVLLFETGLPTRYYIPLQDVRMDLLEESSNTSRCPYKGIASYWNVRIGDTLHEDVLWGYKSPIAECPKIEHLVSFYNEKVEIAIDGKPEERADTVWTA